MTKIVPTVFAGMVASAKRFPTEEQAEAFYKAYDVEWWRDENDSYAIISVFTGHQIIAVFDMYGDFKGYLGED